MISIACWSWNNAGSPNAMKRGWRSFSSSICLRLRDDLSGEIERNDTYHDDLSNSCLPVHSENSWRGIKEGAFIVRILKKIGSTEFLLLSGVIGPLLFIVVFLIEGATRPGY